MNVSRRSHAILRCDAVCCLNLLYIVDVLECLKSLLAGQAVLRREKTGELWLKTSGRPRECVAQMRLSVIASSLPRGKSSRDLNGPIRRMLTSASGQRVGNSQSALSEQDGRSIYVSAGLEIDSNGGIVTV